MLLQLGRPPVVNSIDWTWFGKAHTCLYKVPQLTKQQPSHEVDGIARRARDRIVSKHRSGEGYENISAALKVPKNTVVSIILKWNKFGTTKTLPKAGCPAKLGNRGRMALVKELTKNLVVTLTELWRWENLPEGQPSMQHSTNQAYMVEWPDGSHSSLKGTWQPAWSLTNCT